MDNNANRPKGMWRTMKRQLNFRRLGCCGSSWYLKGAEISMIMDDEEEEEETQVQIQAEEQAQDVSRTRNEDPVDQSPRDGRVSLAMALEFDRHFLRVGPRRHQRPLLRLFEETDDHDHAIVKWYNDSAVDGLCCACVERNKDAAFISCGHTYCRPCSTELWLKRGSCPLCNRPINGILSIY